MCNPVPSLDETDLATINVEKLKFFFALIFLR